MCKHWLCRLTGHWPVATVIEVQPMTIISGLTTTRRWTCSRSWEDLGARPGKDDAR